MYKRQADTTGVFDNDNGGSLYVFWWLAAGSTYSGGTLGTTWHTTEANRVVGQVNLLATAGNDFFLTGVQLEVGPTATEFERRSFGDELRLCQRYAVAYGGSVNNQQIAQGRSAASWEVEIIIPLPVTMRTQALAATVSSNTGFLCNDNSSQAATTSVTIAAISDPTAAYIIANTTGMIANRPCRFMSSTNNKIIITAEL